MRTITLRPRRTAQGGFTLIEVLIAILVLGIGLLGFALLQTMNVRFVQSANYRTQATNLGYELLDQIRANRIAAPTYAGTYKATVTAADCVPSTGKDLGKDAFTRDWRCRLGKSLGEGASGTVSVSSGKVSVAVSWGDERWNKNASNSTTTFTAESLL